MNLTDLVIVGYDGEKTQFSAKLTPEGVVTLALTFSSDGSVTICDRPMHPIEGIPYLITILSDLTSVLAGSPADPCSSSDDEHVPALSGQVTGQHR